MYHFHNQQLYHHSPYHYQPYPTKQEDSKVHILNTGSATATQYHQLPPQKDHSDPLKVREDLQIQPAVTESEQKKITVIKSQASKSEEIIKKTVKKPAVDTSTFTIEERLVAAVWVHERKQTNTTMSEMKHKFRGRFGREPPSKTTLLAWERKLFSSGNVCDAPRTGRPVNRKSHISAVAASVLRAPSLSLRARARALRLPRSTLHTILRHDLPRTPPVPDKQPPGRVSRRPAPPAPRRD